VDVAHRVARLCQIWQKSLFFQKFVNFFDNIFNAKILPFLKYQFSVLTKNPYYLSNEFQNRREKMQLNINGFESSTNAPVNVF